MRHFSGTSGPSNVSANARKRTRVSTNRALLAKLKTLQGCAVCGYTRSSWALAYHHTGSNKSASVSRLVRDGRSWERIVLEIQKCELLCANCHAELEEQMAWGGVAMSVAGALTNDAGDERLPWED